jgi:hypothetical protein
MFVNPPPGGKLDQAVKPLQRRKPMKDLLIVLGIVGVWFLLQAYILPKLGIST